MKTAEDLTLGFSPCPNDTFIFHALVQGRIDTPLSFAEPFLEDVETLNSWAMSGKLDVTKLSFHALGHVLDEYCVLSSGSALGRGCGPLVVAGRELDLKRGEELRIGIPGSYTTAAMLFRMFAPQCTNLVEVRFDRIMESIRNNEIDGGVIIHESRFTYEREGFTALQDLGQWWEETTGLPIPLGCIAARRSLGSEVTGQIDEAIRRSLEMAFADPALCLPYIRQHSQEMEEKVVQDHIGLYVNEYSIDLGDEGRQAVEEFLRRGRKLAILPENSSPLFR